LSFLFTCSDTFVVGCIVQPQYTASQTDDVMMTIADHTACGTIG